MMRLSGLAGTFFILVLLVVELSGASILALGDRAFPTPILIGASVWMSLFGLAMYFYRSGITVPPHGAEFVLWKEILGYRWKSRRRASDVRAVAVCVSVTDEDEPASHLYSVRAVLSDGRVLPVQRHAAKATAILWGERVGKLLNADVVDWTGAA